MKIETNYHSQRNNSLFPYATCGTTILSEYLNFLGYPCTDDAVFEALNSNQMINRANALIQKGDAYIKSLLKKRTGSNFNFLNNSMIMLTEVAKYFTGYKKDFAMKYGTIEQIKSCLNEGFPCGVAGMFTESGHYVLIIGYEEIEGELYFIVDDPYGNWTTKYQDVNGEKLYYPSKLMIPILHKDGEKILYFRAY